MARRSNLVVELAARRAVVDHTQRQSVLQQLGDLGQLGGRHAIGRVHHQRRRRGGRADDTAERAHQLRKVVRLVCKLAVDVGLPRDEVKLRRGDLAEVARLAAQGMDTRLHSLLQRDTAGSAKPELAQCTRSRGGGRGCRYYPRRYFDLHGPC